jgi:hypothetical protein
VAFWPARQTTGAPTLATLIVSFFVETSVVVSGTCRVWGTRQEKIHGFNLSEWRNAVVGGDSSWVPGRLPG